MPLFWTVSWSGKRGCFLSCSSSGGRFVNPEGSFSGGSVGQERCPCFHFSGVAHVVKTFRCPPVQSAVAGSKTSDAHKRPQKSRCRARKAASGAGRNGVEVLFRIWGVQRWQSNRQLGRLLSMFSVLWDLVYCGFCPIYCLSRSFDDQDRINCVSI